MERSNRHLDDEANRPAVAAKQFKAVQLVCQTGLLVLVLIAFFPSASGSSLPSDSLAWLLFSHQDAMFLPLLAAASAASARAAPCASFWSRIAPSRTLPLSLAAALLLLCRVGHELIFLGRDFTRDERMANFDAFVFSNGRLWWPIPNAWRPFHAALNAEFLLPIGGNAAWVSGYLPINAMLRALVGESGDAALTSPLLVAIGTIALWRIGCRLWPNNPSTTAVALLLYASSPQIIVTGMTSFAMSGHLGLNLLWLALFLRGGASSHTGAILIGFLATGLHQPLFHPLFVIPFLVLLGHQRRWRLLGVYLLAYAVIGAFWLAWPIWMSAHAGQGFTPNADAISFGGRLRVLLANIHVDKAIWLTSLNLLRFLAWQHLLLVPLALYGVRVAWRCDPMVAALAASATLPLIASAILLPYQGGGWGYRYLHGVIGNFCLLGGYGWKAARDRGIDLGRMLFWSSLATIAAIVPLRAKAAHDFTSPTARIDRRIAESNAEIAIIADNAGSFGSDLVDNRPDLERPIRIQLSELNEILARQLCAAHPRTLLIGPADFDAANRAQFTRIIRYPRVDADIRMVEAAGCIPH